MGPSTDNRGAPTAAARWPGPVSLDTTRAAWLISAPYAPMPTPSKVSAREWSRWVDEWRKTRPPLVLRLKGAPREGARQHETRPQAVGCLKGLGLCDGGGMQAPLDGRRYRRFAAEKCAAQCPVLLQRVQARGTGYSTVQQEAAALVGKPCGAQSGQAHLQCTGERVRERQTRGTTPCRRQGTPQVSQLAESLEVARGQLVRLPAKASEQIARPSLAYQVQFKACGLQTLQRGHRQHHVADPVAQAHDEGSLERSGGRRGQGHAAMLCRPFAG